MSEIYWSINPKKWVAYGKKSVFLSLDSMIFNLLSIASIAFVLSYIENDFIPIITYLPLIILIKCLKIAFFKETIK